MTRGLTRDELLDDAISKAKDDEDWQLVEWLRMARGGVKAAYWYTSKLNELQAENTKLRKLAKLAIHSACLGCPHNDKKSWKSCEGCNIYEKAAELGVKVEQ